MPISIPPDGVVSSAIGKQAAQLAGIDFPGYKAKYPPDMDLKPGVHEGLHDKLVQIFMERATASHAIMSKRYDTFRELDRTLSSYIVADDDEKAVQDIDPRKPISVVIPSSYAVLDTLLTYLVAAFLDDPIFKYEGHGPEDIVGGLLLEKVIQLQCNKFKISLSLYTMWRDFLVYGFGVVLPTWREERTIQVRRKKASALSMMFGLSSSAVQEFEEAITFQGSALINVDPYLFLPDANVPIHKAQEGEFVGWMERDNWMSLAAEETLDKDLFNINYLKNMKPATSKLYEAARPKRGAPESVGVQQGTISYGNPVDVVNILVDIIPKDLEMGTDTTPQLWKFSIAADRIIIRAKRLKLNHRKKPIVVGAPDYDGYSVAPISRIERTLGVQKIVDWLINTHIVGKRKVIQDMIVYDPTVINTEDLLDPKPGKLIRMRMSNFGKYKVSDFIQQLDVKDVTSDHIPLAETMSQIMFRTSGAQDSVQGIRRESGDRVTATEFQGVQGGALSRLEKLAKLTSIQAHHDIAEMFAFHTQQFMTEDVYIKTVGDWPEVLAQEYGLQRGDRKLVTPMDISVPFDVIIKDGSTPSGEHAQTWIQLMQILSSNPQLLRKFDVTRIMTHIARLTGVRNFHEFLIKGGQVDETIVTDQEVEEEKIKGNLVSTAIAADSADRGRDNGSTVK